MKYYYTIRYSIGILIILLCVSRIIQFLYQPGATVVYQLVSLDPNESYNLIEGLVIGILLLLITIPIFLVAMIIYLISGIMNLLAKNSKIVIIGTIILSFISISLGIRAIIIASEIDMISAFYILHLIGYSVIFILSLISLIINLKGIEGSKENSI